MFRTTCISSQRSSSFRRVVSSTIQKQQQPKQSQQAVANCVVYYSSSTTNPAKSTSSSSSNNTSNRLPVALSRTINNKNRATTTLRTQLSFFNNNNNNITSSSLLNHNPNQQQQQKQQQQQIRSIFIQTTETPNPESLKFIPTGVPVLADVDSTGNGYYITKTDPSNEILRSPLCKKLLDIDGVKAVYLGADFVTVTKYAESKWKLLRPQIFECIMEWVDSGTAALLDEPLITDTTILDDDSEIVAMIKELIESRIRPAVQEDGGDIRYVNFEESTGIVTVKLAGSCVGCPSSSVTLKQGVENMLMHYIPEVTTVVAQDDVDDANETTLHPQTDDDTTTTTTTNDDNDNNNDNNKESDTKNAAQKTYEQRLAQAGIPFSD